MINRESAARLLDQRIERINNAGPDEQAALAQDISGNVHRNLHSSVTTLIELATSEDGPIVKAALRKLARRDVDGAVKALIPALPKQDLLDAVDLLQFSTVLHLETERQLLAAVRDLATDPGEDERQWSARSIVARMNLPELRSVLEPHLGATDARSGWAEHVFVDRKLLITNEQHQMTAVAAEFFELSSDRAVVVEACLHELSRWGAEQIDLDRLYGKSASVWEELGMPVSAPSGLQRLLENHSGAIVFAGVLDHKHPELAELFEAAYALEDRSFFTACDNGKPLRETFAHHIATLGKAMDDSPYRLTPPSAWSRRTMVDILQRHGIPLDSAVGAVAANAVSSRIIRLPEVLMTFDGAEARELGRAHGAGPGYVRPHKVKLGERQWSAAATAAFDRVARSFVTNPANARAVAESLSTTIQELHRSATAARTDRLRNETMPELVQLALEQSPSVRARFTTFLGRAKGNGLRDAAVLADSNETPGLSAVVAPVRHNIQARAVQSAGPVGFDITR